MNSALPIRRNTALLSLSLASLYGMLQLVAAVATVTFVAVSHVEGLVGLGVAILQASAAVAAQTAGRLMDRHGRVPVLAGGFVVGGLGSVVTGLGVLASSVALVVVGFVLIGCGNGTVQLVRAAAGDMYPAEKRGRGISLVLSGSVVGALLGPFVFSPLFSAHHMTPSELAVPWFASSGFMLLGLLLVTQVRPDPIRIAALLAARGAAEAPPPAAPAEPLARILRRPGVGSSLAAAVASFGVMVALMNLTGYIVIGHGHPQHSVFTIVAAHFVGMFGFVLVVGWLIDRFGRTRAIATGLALVAASSLVLLWIDAVAPTAVALLILGLGWNLSFVGATAELTALASVSERGKLLGFSDMLSSVLAGSLALLGGWALSARGAGTIALGAAAIAAVPLALLAVRRIRYNPAPASA